MACPQQNNIDAKRAEKTTKYRQISFQTREWRPGTCCPSCSGSFGWWYQSDEIRLEKDFENDELLDEIIAMMQRTVLMDSESIIRRVISGLIQGEDIESVIFIYLRA